MADVSRFFELESGRSTAVIIAPGGFNEKGLTCLGQQEVVKLRDHLFASGLSPQSIVVAEGAGTKAAANTLQLFLNGNFRLISPTKESCYAALENYSGISYLEAFRDGLSFERVLSCKAGQSLCARWGLPDRLSRATETWDRIKKICLANPGKVVLVCIHGYGYRIEPAITLAESLAAQNIINGPDDLPDPKFFVKAADAIIVSVSSLGVLLDYAHLP